MKLRIAIVLAALIPVFFAMQNCGSGGGATSNTSNSSNDDSSGGSNLAAGLQGSCTTTSSSGTKTSCLEAYGLLSQVTLAGNNCALSQPNGSINSFVANGHCDTTVFKFKCDITGIDPQGRRMGWVNFVPASMEAFARQTCPASATFSATN